MSLPIDLCFCLKRISIFKNNKMYYYFIVRLIPSLTKQDKSPGEKTLFETSYNNTNIVI